MLILLCFLISFLVLSPCWDSVSVSQFYLKLLALYNSRYLREIHITVQLLEKQPSTVQTASFLERYPFTDMVIGIYMV